MNILLVSHGQLCQGMNDAFHMFAPTATCVHAVSLTTEGGVEQFRTDLSAKLEELLAQGDVLIAADLRGAPLTTSLLHTSSRTPSICALPRA